MKKYKVIIMAVMAIFVGFVSMMVVNAAQTTINDTSNLKQLTITREVENVSNPVTNTFSYTVEADSSNPAAVTGLPAANATTVVFNNVAPDANHTAKATGILDLSGLTFTKVGNYKFKVTETRSSNATSYPLDTEVYYIYVSVRYEVDANNVPDNDKLIATLASQAKISDTGPKVDILFSEGSEHTYITISKKVTGNLGEKGDYFNFKVNIGGEDGAEYNVTGQSKNGATTTCTAKTDCVISLKHGETAIIGQKTANGNTINQIPIDVKYNITETGATDYKTFIDGSTTNKKVMDEKTTVKETAPTFNVENKTSFVNNKEEASITGMFLNIFPFIVLFILGFVGIYYIRKTSNES